MINMKYFLFSFFIIAGNGFAQFQNITLPRPKKATYFASQVEPSICINPYNPNEIIAGSVMNDYYFSKDGGLTWKAKSIKAENGVNGDPCMIIDSLGNYYYFHLSNINGQSLVGGMVCQRSKSVKGKFKYEGTTLQNGLYHDKQWVAVDPENNNLYITWTQFDAYDSKDPKDKSHILFSSSSDLGISWSIPDTISKFPGDCKDNDHTAEGAVPAVGPNGEIYVSWSRNDSLWFNVSFDRGKSWLKEEVFIGEQTKGWVLDIPGIFRCNGLPVTTCDLSHSPNRGTIYVNYADQSNGEDNTDIWLLKSTDQGNTWSEPIRVNSDDSKKHQFLTWMTIDKVTGYLYFVFYDRRKYDDNKTDVYIAVSMDGGESFDNYCVSESPFLPNPSIFFGDYTNISVYNGIIRPIWTRLHQNRITLHTAIVHQNELK